MSIVFKFAEKVSIIAEDARYDVMFENLFERRNTRDDNPMVEFGRDYDRPLCKQRITIMPTSRPNYFGDYECLSADLDNELAADFLYCLKVESNMNMWFCKDQLHYAAKHGTLIYMPENDEPHCADATTKFVDCAGVAVPDNSDELPF